MKTYTYPKAFTYHSDSRGEYVEGGGRTTCQLLNAVARLTGRYYVDKSKSGMSLVRGAESGLFKKTGGTAISTLIGNDAIGAFMGLVDVDQVRKAFFDMVGVIGARRLIVIIPGDCAPWRLNPNMSEADYSEFLKVYFDYRLYLRGWCNKASVPYFVSEVTADASDLIHYRKGAHVKQALFVNDVARGMA